MPTGGRMALAELRTTDAEAAENRRGRRGCPTLRRLGAIAEASLPVLRRLLDHPRLERLDRRTIDHLAVRLEARPVAGAIPGLLGLVPVHVAPEVRADRRHGVQLAIVGARAREGAAIDLHDLPLSGLDRLE